ncbi:unnamed protein product [Brachionus calyciflorus]|uniref:Uncharacterized protein n=1 Tax=Brachionus calyciflorus TaxID=104777 RepID=A0A814KG52_9BILA|nr:unnamed protein product [Brachionus calyciflorus]
MVKIILSLLILTLIKSAYVEGYCENGYCYNSYTTGFGASFSVLFFICCIRCYRQRRQRAIIVRRNMPVSIPYTVSTIDSMSSPPPDYNTVIQSNIQPSHGYTNPNFKY